MYARVHVRAREIALNFCKMAIRDLVTKVTYLLFIYNILIYMQFSEDQKVRKWCFGGDSITKPIGDFWLNLNLFKSKTYKKITFLITDNHPWEVFLLLN